MWVTAAGAKPIGATATGSARKPPPTVVPAINRAALVIEGRLGIAGSDWIGTLDEDGDMDE